MPTPLRIRQFETTLPDAWQDQTVHVYKTSGGEAQIKIEVERFDQPVTAQQIFTDRTQTMRDPAVGMQVLEEGRVSVGGQAGYYLVLKSPREQDAQETYMIVVGKPTMDTVVVADLRADRDKWKAARVSFERVLNDLAGERLG